MEHTIDVSAANPTTVLVASHETGLDSKYTNSRTTYDRPFSYVRVQDDDTRFSSAVGAFVQGDTSYGGSTSSLGVSVMRAQLEKLEELVLKTGIDETPPLAGDIPISSGIPFVADGVGRYRIAVMLPDGRRELTGYITDAPPAVLDALAAARAIAYR